MTRAQAEGLRRHKERPFYGELVETMTAGPVVVQVLEGENAILKNREIMGATNPANAAPAPSCREFALSVARTRCTVRRPEATAEEIVLLHRRRCRGRCLRQRPHRRRRYPEQRTR
jgi:nucleoside-diphosphate kinase